MIDALVPCPETGTWKRIWQRHWSGEELLFHV